MKNKIIYILIIFMLVGVLSVPFHEQAKGETDVKISVSYSAQPAENVPKGSSVAYTAELTSKSDIPITNIKVIDNVHGELGAIDVLQPGETKTVSKSFSISDSVESYMILQFDNPFAEGEQLEQSLKNTKLSVKVVKEVKEVPEPKVSIAVRPSRTSAKGATDVNLNAEVKNTGNATLTDIKILDWNGNVVSTKDKLQPGGSYSAQFTGRMEPGKAYKITCRALAEGSNKSAETSDEVKLSKIEPAVNIDRKVIPETYGMGDKITIQYIIRNTGNVGLRDITLKEPQWQEQVGNLDSLDPGEEKTVSKEIHLDVPLVSEVVLTGYDKSAGEKYVYEATALSIGQNIADDVSKLDIKLESDPEKLDEPGSVKLLCTIENISSASFKNIEISLKERDIVLGSFVELPAGAKETIESLPIDIEETTTFRVVVKGINSAGNKVEFTSSPLTIEVVEPEEDDNKQDGRRAILKTVLVVIALLIVFVTGTLIYVIKKPKLGDKKETPGKSNIKGEQKTPKRRMDKR